ncbi:hypothetical protein [Prosthecomicrobium hirschii]|uniref:hypothetical protein n=1 Tax=Prosthecodimorpha hirschii TaxID=665126 RepID=UPI002220F387|nr:hypothetical protein [Prosthecomicrobium hirschii]MCW1844172.1 hypothetical protein [Prosthecomicrobium hirschii]
MEREVVALPASWICGDPGVIDIIRKVVRTHRWRLEDEKVLQGDLHVEFVAAGLSVEREVRLSPRDIIDFRIGAIGIEVKIKGSKRDIYRQIERYCGHGVLSSIVLIMNAPVGMPAEISGTPVHVIGLTGALA